MQSDCLPENVIAEILSRLPVKTLIRFKCVCTQWRSLISNPFFASLHLSRSVSNPTRHSILVHELRRQNRHVSLDPHLNLGFDQTYPFGPGIIYVGSIDGLVCILGAAADILLIWNPSTRMFKTLPLGRHTDPCGITIGFGWDDINNDYKVVKIGSSYGEFVEWAEVWSANLDSWKDIKVDRKFCLITNCCDAIVNGYAYFFGQDRPGNDGITLVASFDMRAEVIQLVPVPDSLLGLGQQYDFNAMNWKETFALVARDSPEPRKKYQVWTMENGSAGKKYWSKKFTLELDLEFYRTVNSVSGKFILRRHRNLILYDVETRETKTVGRVKFPVLGAHYCVESLMSIKGFKHFGDDARRRWNEQELNKGHVSIEMKF